MMKVLQWSITVTSFLGLTLLLRIAVDGLLVAAQEPAPLSTDEMTLIQVTRITNTTSSTFKDALLSGNGRKVVYGAPWGFNYERTLYLTNSDGTGTPYAFYSSVGDPDIKDIRLLDVSYDGKKILFFKDKRYGECSVEHFDPCGYFLYDVESQTSTRATPCYTDSRISTQRCLSAATDNIILSGDGNYIFLFSGNNWQCVPESYDYGGHLLWRWNCRIPSDQKRLWRVSIADLGNPDAAELWGGLDDVLPENSRLYSYDLLYADYAGGIAAILLTITGESGGTLPESGIYFSRGSRLQRIPTVDVVDHNYLFRLSADGNWVAYSPPYIKEYHIQHASGSPHYTHLVPDSLQYNYLRGITQDGQQTLFEDRMVEEYPLWIADREGNFNPLTGIAPGPLCDSAHFSYDGQKVACPMDKDNTGDAQYFVLHGQANPDLSVDAFTLDLAAVTHSGGKYILPVDVTVRNSGENAAADIKVRFSDNGGWSETQTIDNLAVNAGKVLHLDWDITNLLNDGKGKATVKLTVVADPDNAIVEAGEINNTAESSVEVDARPQLTQVKSGYRPGTFLAGAAIQNNFDVWVDWNGDLSGTGDADEPKEVVYDLNGAQTLKSINNPAAAPAASHTYDMSVDLKAGANTLHIQAENSAGFQSDKQTFTLHRADNAAWLASVAMDTEADPPDAEYDKIAVYKSEFEWPNETLAEYFDVPANKVNILKKEYGPKLDSWSLGVEFRSDGCGEVNGSGGFEGEIKGTVALNTTVSATGAVRATDQLYLTKLEGALRGEGEFSTPRIPLSPWLPFLYAQSKIGAGADATLGVYEQANGELEWSPLILGLDATVEGTLSAGYENIAYVEGGIGGQPRGEFNLPADPKLLRSLTIRLYAWSKGKFLVWEKGYDAEYVCVISESTGREAYAYALKPRSSDWHLSDLSYVPRAVSTVGPQAMDYAYADPALSIAGDDTMMLLWVDDEAAQLEIRASRWDGLAWSTTVNAGDNAFLDAHPDVAYDSAGNAVTLWSQIITATLPSDPHDALANMDIVSAVWTGASWIAPTRLTTDVQMDFRPKVEADRNGNVMAMWLKDADNSFPLYPDEDTETLGGDLYYTLWNSNSITWTTPALALSGVSSNEAPQLARNGDNALTVWSQDADGSVGTITDTAIYYANWISPTWGLSQTLSGAGDSIADFSPRIAYDSIGQANLIWVKGRVAQSADPDDAVDQLYFSVYTNTAWSPPVLAVEAAAIQGTKLLVDSQDNLVALWLARSDVGMDLWYAVYDRSAQLWSDPILFTHDKDAQTDYDAVIDSADALRVVLTGREMTTVIHTVSDTQRAGTSQAVVYPDFGEARPAEHQHTLGRDLTMTNLVISPTNPASGTTATLIATARNSGDLAITGAQVAFYDGNPDSGGVQIGATQPLTSPFRAGVTGTVSIQWDVPADAVSHTIYAVSDPANTIAESIESNNRISLTTVLPDLNVDWAHTNWGGNVITVTANIRNAGVSPTTSPFSVALRIDNSISGATVISANVSTLLTAGQSVTVSLAMTNPGDVLTGSHTGWVVADAGSAIAEADEANNNAFTALNVLPDLTLMAADIAGSAPVTITVHNIGLITAPSATVVIYRDGLTGTLLYSDTVGSIAVGGTSVVTVTLAPGDYTLYVQLDPDDLVAETDKSNNLAVQEMGVLFRIYLPLVLRSHTAP
ncbi:MAG TPA: hypothetical protein G4N96_10245 [Chloroflexi bacterium]|nr:hypothetical protein [Chloroflexota bacterium]